MMIFLIKNDMTEEDIRKLATQFADDMFKDDDMSDSGNIDEYHDVWEVCNSFGNFLLEKFCIVEKEKVETLQNEIHGEIMCAHDDDDWQSVAHYILDVMPRSFNELFNDTEK